MIQTAAVLLAIVATSPIALTQQPGGSLRGLERVSVDRDQLTLRFGSTLSGRLDHWASDTYRLTWLDSGSALAVPMFVSFVADPFGGVTSLRVRDDVMCPPGMRNRNNDEFARVEEPAVTSTWKGGR
jgi:hypothetical protein